MNASRPIISSAAVIVGRSGPSPSLLGLPTTRPRAARTDTSARLEPAREEEIERGGRGSLDSAASASGGRRLRIDTRIPACGEASMSATSSSLSPWMKRTSQRASAG